MPLHVEEHVVRAFDENLRLLFEQEGSRLRPYVDVKTGVVGKAASWNVFIGEAARQKVIATTGRHEDHTQDDLDGIVSWAVLQFWYQALPVDPQDAVKLLMDPKGKYAVAIANTLGRQCDANLIAAAIGSATRGEDMGTSTALPSAQKVAAASTGMTVAKLRAAKKILDQNEVTGPRTIAVNADMMDDLLGTTEVTSSDFNTVKALVNGDFNTFLGFHFVRTEKIISTGSTATGAVAFAQASLGLAIAEEYNRVAQRRDKHDEWEAYGRVQFGCVRTDDKGVVQINVA